MPIPNLDEYTIIKYINRFALLFGIFVIIYAILWILAELEIIPAIIFAIFPQIVLLLVGIFIVYIVLSRRNKY